MRQIKKHRQKFIAAIIVIGGVFASAFIFAYSATAQTGAVSSDTASLQGVTFPIPELGNCSSKSDCRSYCNDPSHIQACVSFAEAHGLMDKGEAEQAKVFAGLLQSGETPGGCRTEDECRAYCSDMTHLDACLSFAKKLGVNDEHSVQGGKILAYLKAGGKLPGGCNSEESCKDYCGDFSHAEACYAFAKNAGIAQASESSLRGEAQRILELMKNGGTPGGCTSTDGCESYCADPAHRGECLAFGVKAGFMTQEQADAAEKTGGKGPGGCDSEDACRAYCDNPANQQECLKFAGDHGVLSEEDAGNIQNGILQLRAGLDQAPPEAISCLRSELGQSIIDGIMNGTLLPGSELADTIKSCLEEAGHPEQGGGLVPSPSTGNENVPPGQVPPAGSFQNFLNDAPPQVASCLKQALGDAFDKLKSGEMPPTSDIAEKMRACYSQMYNTSATPPYGRPPGGE